MQFLEMEASGLRLRNRWIAGGKMDGIGQPIKLALRRLLHNPGFTVAAVVTLALSIGANTAIFSVVNALLLKWLPYVHPERIGTIHARTTGPDAADVKRFIDGEQWELLRDDVPSVDAAVSVPDATGVNLQYGSHVQYLHAGRVSAHYFEALALHPIIGRNFSGDEDRPHGPKAAILSYSLWRTVFERDPKIVGRAVLLKGEPYTIVGVLAENATTPLNADVYTPLQPSREGEGQGTNFSTIVRLHEDATWQRADAEINRALNRSSRAQLFANSNSGVQLTYYSLPLQQAETAELRPQVLALMLATVFILLIACANLAGLTLVRMTRRVGEMATRLALGASHWQVQKELWIENMMLALAGGAAAIGVGFLTLRGLLLLLPEHFLPIARVPLDGRVLGFTLCLALLTSLLFGMLPAIATRKLDLRSSVTSRAVIHSGRVRLRQALIAGEVALTVVLLAGTGLIIRTLVHLETLPAGFNPTGVLTAKASLDSLQYQSPSAFRKLLDQSLASMREIRGVQNAAVGLTLPYERALVNGVALADGKNAGQTVSTDEVYVTPSYFETLQIAVLAGRGFSDSDGSEAQRVVVVNQVFARKFFRDENPVGRYLGDNNQSLLIVGVVANTIGSSASGLTDDPAPLTSEETIYLPAAQVDDPKFLAVAHAFFQPSWIVRTSGPVQELAGLMQRALASADPNLPFSGFYDMRDLKAKMLATQRIEVALLTAMASLALLLSAVGIFALVANLVAQRTREIGIRMALGSTVREAMIHVGSLGIGASASGLLLGLILCGATLRAMQSAIYGVGVYDASTLLAVVLTLSAVTVLATAVPALRIARIDPAKTLREE
jgi:macrolide transport system ATP-binding/permease protein